MLQHLSISLENIRNINSCEVSIDFSPGIYAIVGSNGCGKSTIMQALSILVRKDSLRMFRNYDLSSYSKIFINISGVEDKLEYSNGRWRFNNSHVFKLNNAIRGFYEGSIFYGTRFYDFDKIDEVIATTDMSSNLRDADDYVKNTLSYILHGNHNHYRALKKIWSKQTARTIGLRGIPYFFEKNGYFISQFRMSSGECMLISLIDFVYNIIERKNYVQNETILLLIDEVELALHPSAIDRLLDYFSRIVETAQCKTIVCLSTHSSEVIQKIPPKRIYLLENENGQLDVISPCYPNYAIRNLYVPNGFDYIILVEDELAKCIVNKLIRDHCLGTSKLICVLPSGGWSQTLKLHNDMVTYNTLGVGKKLISIYDGDIESEVKKSIEYKNLPKHFIPIQSIEKYLRKKLILDSDVKFKKHIGDKYFSQKSINSVVAEYNIEEERAVKKDSNGKKLYNKLIHTLRPTGITEERFIEYLCEDIFSLEQEKIDKFAQSLTGLLN